MRESKGVFSRAPGIKYSYGVPRHETSLFRSSPGMCVLGHLQSVYATFYIATSRPPCNLVSTVRCFGVFPPPWRGTHRCDCDSVCRCTDLHPSWQELKCVFLVLNECSLFFLLTGFRTRLPRYPWHAGPPRPFGTLLQKSPQFHKDAMRRELEMVQR